MKYLYVIPMRASGHLQGPHIIRTIRTTYRGYGDCSIYLCAALPIKISTLRSGRYEFTRRPHEAKRMYLG